jgi:hypothetical protein
VAQTKKKRRKKHKGTQGGRIDTARRSKPRTRAEAQAQARSRRSGSSRPAGAKVDNPPTWKGAINRALIAAAIFALLLLVIFHRPPAAAIGLAAFMLVFYVPAGYYMDSYMWRRRERGRIRSQQKG